MIPKYCLLYTIIFYGDTVSMQQKQRSALSPLPDIAPYPNDYKLAKISGSRRDDYLAMYQNIVSRMKKQPKYPVRFMQMNPDPSMQQARRGREMERPRVMTDGE